MDDYWCLYIKFVETIALFTQEMIEQNGVISTKNLSERISTIIAEHPEVCVALWARGLTIRDGLDVFEGVPLEDVEVAYSLALENNAGKNHDLTIAGIRAPCEEFRRLQTCTTLFREVRSGIA